MARTDLRQVVIAVLIALVLAVLVDLVLGGTAALVTFIVILMLVLLR